MTSSTIDKKLEIYTKLEIELEINKNLEYELEIDKNLENFESNFEFFVNFEFYFEFFVISSFLSMVDELTIILNTSKGFGRAQPMKVGSCCLNRINEPAFVAASVSRMTRIGYFENLKRRDQDTFQACAFFSGYPDPPTAS